MEDGPKTLLEAVRYFKDDEFCISYLARKRWPDGRVICPTCGGDRVHYLREHKRWQCSNRHPKRQFSIKVGTIMEDSPIGLHKWLPLMWLVANCRNGISSWEVHRDLGVTQKTAWLCCIASGLPCRTKRKAENSLARLRLTRRSSA